MPPPPDRPPFTNFARAVQAYAISRLRGGSLQQAEQAALAAYPNADIPAVARAAISARAAGQALESSGPGAGSIWATHSPLAGEPGFAEVVVTAHVSYRLGTGRPGQQQGELRWTTVQVAIPANSTQQQAAALLRDAARDQAGGDEYEYGGELDTIDVLTAIGI